MNSKNQCDDGFYKMGFNRERTPPRPQGQRPEPENRGVSIAHKYTSMAITKKI